MQRTHLLRRAAALAALTLAAACGDDDPAAPPGTLTVAASRSDLTITQGLSDTLTLTITRGGSFTGPVTLTSSGEPTGVTVTLASPTIAQGSVSSAATVTVVAAVAPGTYPITITAAGTGITPSPTATINLSVVAAQVADFGVSASVDTVNITAGRDSAMAYVRLSKMGGFAAAVSLTTDSLPPGVRVAFADTSLTGDSTRITIRAEAAVPASSFDVTIRGRSDTTTRTDKIRVNVAVPADFALAIEPDTMTLVAGTNGQVRVRAMRSGGLADTVRLVLQPAPAGVTGTFGTPSLGGDSTVLTIATADSTAPGIYALIVQGTAGSLVRTDTMALTVNPRPVVKSLDIALLPTGDSLSTGSTDTITVVATRTGFTDTVKLTTDSLPQGVKVTIDTAGITGDTARVPISVDSTAVPGTYSIRFIGSATGVPSDTATYTLVVKAAGGGSSGRVGRSVTAADAVIPARRGRTSVTPHHSALRE